MSKLYFTQPLFRQDSPDFKHLASLPAHFTLDTPGARLALALNYYACEAYASEIDRDAACGMTAHPDIKYVSVDAVSDEDIADLSCGHSIDHLHFERVLGPIFNRKVEQLIGKMIGAGRKAEGPIAMEALSIARIRYEIQAIAEHDVVAFKVEGVSLFEKGDRNTIEATCVFLEERLRLHLLPTQPKRKAH